MRGIPSSATRRNRPAPQGRLVRRHGLRRDRTSGAGPRCRQRGAHGRRRGCRRAVGRASAGRVTARTHPARTPAGDQPPRSRQGRSRVEDHHGTARPRGGRGSSHGPTALDIPRGCRGPRRPPEPLRRRRASDPAPHRRGAVRPGRGARSERGLAPSKRRGGGPRLGSSHERRVQNRKSVWSGREDFNLRPHRPERCALPSFATPRPRVPVQQGRRSIPQAVRPGGRPPRREDLACPPRPRTGDYGGPCPHRPAAPQPGSSARPGSPPSRAAWARGPGSIAAHRAASRAPSINRR